MAELRPSGHALVGGDRTERHCISTLIGTVKAYTFMDQAPIQPVDIHQGLENTLSMLHNELDNVQIMRTDLTLPIVEARGSELNQVWTSLIDNAIDAMQGNYAFAIDVQRERLRDGRGRRQWQWHPR